MGLHIEEYGENGYHPVEPMVVYMGVSKNRGTQNGWLIMENPIKMDDLGGFPIIFGSTPTSHYFRPGFSTIQTVVNLEWDFWVHQRCMFHRCVEFHHESMAGAIFVSSLCSSSQLNGSDSIV